jgi:predicted outer membrane repeat protein
VVTDAGDTGAAGQLRQIMATADSNGQDDTITFQAGITTINLVNGQISLTTQNNLLTIDGGSGVTINGSATASATNRIFNFNVSAGNPTITLKNLTLANCNLSSGNNGGAIQLNNDPLVLNNVNFTNNKTASAGGAIATTASVAETITITNGTFSGNSATGNVGGAINGTSTLTLSTTGTVFSGNFSSSTGGAINAASASTITINSSTFSGNSSSSAGGAINAASTISFNASDSTFSNNLGSSCGVFRSVSSSATVTLTRCTVSGNSATGTTGGGIYVSAGTLNVSYTTVSGNVATTAGGGININSATVTLTNCTISGNSALGNNAGGGGIGVGSGPLTINNCTIANNIAGGTGTAGGGGIRKSSTTGSLTLQSTIVANNISTGSGGPDINLGTTGTLAIGGGDNLVGVSDIGNFTLSGTNQTGVAAAPLDPRLAPLGNNGGPTLTQGFRFDSPAIDNGDNLAGKTNDQRGAGFPRVVGAQADIGALESPLLIPFADGTSGIADVTTGGGTSYGFTVTFNDETGIDTTTLNTGEVTISGPSGFFTTAATCVGFTAGTGNKINAQYQFTPPGGSWDVMDNGAYTINLATGKLLDIDTPTPHSAIAATLGMFNVGIGGNVQVDTTAEGDDGNVSPGNVSLREALRITNASVGSPDTITFSSLFNSPQTITLTTGQLNVADSVTIIGPGSGKLTISGAATASLTNRIFSIIVPNVVANVTISGMTLTNANSTGAGGAIVVSDENVTLSDMVITGNKSTNIGAAIAGTNFQLTISNSSLTFNSSGSAGGAIGMNSGTSNALTITNCTFSNNTSATQGGAVSGTSTIALDVTDSLFNNNTCASGGGAMNIGATTGTGTIGNCTFTSNTSTGSSGVAGALNFPSTGSDITINSSSFTSNSANTSGGAINVGGNSTVGISSCTFNGNIASTIGGAIQTASTITLTIDNSQFTGNSAAATGGAIRLSSSTGANVVTLTNTTLSGNTGTAGGGVYVLNGGSLTINNSTLNNNVASTAGGGGIRVGSGTLTLSNSTISGNIAATTGGGIRMAVAGATLTVANSTITNNSATGGKGGGVYFIGNTNTVQFDSTIVAGNLGATNRDLGASVTPQTIGGANNLFGAIDPTIISISIINQSGTEAAPLDAKLSPLGAFGGPTQTHGLLTGSPALDMGSNPNNLTTDQRGPGFPRQVGTAVDVGAFEGILTIPTASASLPNVNTAGGTDYVATVTYNDAGSINTSTIDVNDVTITTPSATTLIPTSVTFSGSGTSVTAMYHFTPPGGSWDFFDGGVYTLNMVANQVTNSNNSAVLAGSLGTFTVSIAQALLVDTLADVDNGNYMPGDLSLREAVKLANLYSPGATDTITFAAALNGGTISLVSGQIAITDPLIINGPGASQLTIAGAAAASTTNRIFNINITAPNAPVTITGLTLTSGNITGAGGAINLVDEVLSASSVTFSGNKSTSTGAAINATGAATITLNNCTFNNNSAGSSGGAVSMTATTGAQSLTVTNSNFASNTATTSGSAINGGSTVSLNVSGCTMNANKGTGGTITATMLADGSSISNTSITNNSGAGVAISSVAGSWGISDSTISGNSVASQGGGIRFTGTIATTLNVTRSTISGNIAASIRGGGIYVPSATLNVTDSTISGNTVTGSVGGGGISSYTGNITITNSTISGNVASGASALGGGGIKVDGGVLTINNSTVTNNSCANASTGGGISLSVATTVVSINSSIIAQNIAATHPDLQSSTASLTVNATDSIIGASTDSNIVLNLAGNSVAGTFANPINAGLQPLANNGGPTQTHALTYFSPALDKGNNALSLANDQRGTGFSRTLNGATDMGAFEGISAIPQAIASPATVTTPGATSQTISVTYGDDIGIDTSTIDVNDITVTGPFGAVFTPTSASFTGSGNTVTATYTFTPPGGSWDIFDNGSYTISMVANQVADLDATTHYVPAGPFATLKVAIAGPVAITVDLATDVADGNLTPGHVSLRNAINFTNATLGGTDTINFAPALNGQTITLSLGQLPITDALFINGPGASLLTINANSASRIFNINDGTANAIPVTISGLTLTGGLTTGSGAVASGGAIQMAPENVTLNNVVLSANSSATYGGAIGFSTSGGNTLTINNCTLSNNKALGGAGGGVGTNGGTNTITVNDSVLIGNVATGNGGSIDTGPGGGQLFVNRCSITGNSASANGGACAAGYATFTFTDCTLSGNTAGNGGGALVGYSNHMTLTNCTIANNKATVNGGGISFSRSAAAAQEQLTLNNCTIVGNSAGTNGGGIRMATLNASNTSFINITNSIVSGNTCANSPDIFTASTAGYTYINYSAVDTTIGYTPNVNNANNIAPGTPLLLGTLANNGGPRQTIALLSGSPAINAGQTTTTLTNDGRGAGYARLVGSALDIGAYEVQAPPTVATIVVNDGAVQRSRVTKVTVTFSQFVNLPANPADAFQLMRQSDSALPALTAAVDNTGPGTVVTLSFSGTTAVDFGSLADGRYTLTIDSSKVTNPDGADLDGNGDGTGGDNYVEVGAPGSGHNLFRFYGDINGDGTVSASDFIQFRQFFGGINDAFDFNGDGSVAASDFIQFRLRFGGSI